MEVKTLCFDKIQDFFKELEERHYIQLVKINDQSLTLPVRENGAVWITPLVRVVASVYDIKTNEILKWDRSWKVGQYLTVNGGVGIGGYDATGLKTRRKIVLECQKKSLHVVYNEEWTTEDFEDSLE